MKRITVFVAVALCLIVPMLAGCSLLESDSQDTPSTSTPADPTDGNEASEPDESADADDGGSAARQTVPNVIDMDAAAAIDRLEEAGFKATLSWRRNDAEHRTVLSQSIAADEMLAPGSYVRLVVSLGPTPTVPPPPLVVAAREAAASSSSNSGGETSGGGTTSGGGSTTTPDGGGFTDDPNDVPGVALPASPVTGSLSVGDPVDVYRVMVTAGQKAFFSVNLGGSTTDPDFRVKLLPPTASSTNGTAVSSVTSGEYPRNLTYTATTTGYFYVVVEHADTTPGTGGVYSLSWSVGSF